MEKTKFFLLVCLLTCTILVACGPSQVEQGAQATRVAADVFATQTAEAVAAIPASTDTPVPLAKPTSTALTEELPTETQVPTHTPYPTYTPLPASTATPVPTDTPIPPTDTPVLPTDTPITTDTPIPPTDTPLPPTDTPVPTATPSPAPTVCPILPEGGFLTLWQSDPDLQSALGCPTSYHPRITPEAWQVKTSYQPFENGEMIWSDHIGWYGQPVVYVTYANSTYQRFDDTFDPAVDPVSGGETPPNGLVEPILGMGKVWREEPGLREALGWATVDETPGLGRFQMFTRGNMVWISQTDKTYVFIEGMVHVFDVPFR